MCAPRLHALGRNFPTCFGRIVEIEQFAPPRPGHLAWTLAGKQQNACNASATSSSIPLPASSSRHSRRISGVGKRAILAALDGALFQTGDRGGIEQLIFDRPVEQRDQDAVRAVGAHWRRALDFVQQLDGVAPGNRRGVALTPCLPWALQKDFIVAPRRLARLGVFVEIALGQPLEGEGVGGGVPLVHALALRVGTFGNTNAQTVGVVACIRQPD